MTLLTLGGGGFSDYEPADPAISADPLDTFLLRLTRKRRPRIAFIPTASGDAPSYIAKFHAAFPSQRARASVISLFKPDHIPLETKVLSQDILFVGGGSTANLLAIWRLHKLPPLLRKAARQGTILAGISAGMNCWFQACSTDSFGPLAPLPDGLRFLPGAACPHFDTEPERRPSVLKWVAKSKLPLTYAADDHAAFLWNNGQLARCVKSRLQAGCYKITRQAKHPLIESLPTDLLE